MLRKLRNDGNETYENRKDAKGPLREGE